MNFVPGVARSLEAGRGGALSAGAAYLWGAAAARSLARPLTFPESARIIVVGGSTLGGSGKTPLAVACAAALSDLGADVVVVGHAYRARPLRPRVVAADDDVAVVGDEALVAAHALASRGVRVVVADRRQAALDHALSFGRVVVVDGVNQCRPAPAHLALLAVDATRPWGSGFCLPRGDLRAPRDRLVAACDRVVVVGAGECDVARDVARDVPVDAARAFSEGAFVDGRLLEWDGVRARRVALLTTLSRPLRILASLARAGVAPEFVASHADHCAPSSAETARAVARAGRHGVNLWLATAKCATHLSSHVGSVPLATLAYELRLDAPLVRALAAAAS